ncbi:MAG: hypothetical protein ABI286_11160 [Edaphobacter sp.]
MFLVLPATRALSQFDDNPPAIQGYVTRVASLADFDASGYRVIINKATMVRITGTGGESFITTVTPYFGQGVTIYGTLKKKKHQVIAEDVVFHPVDQSALSGIAIIDRVLSPGNPVSGAGRLLMRADGYLILVNAATKTSFQAPLDSATDVKPNVWIEYHGKMQADGILLADTVVFIENKVADNEAKLLDKFDYDPSTVDANAKQNIAKEIVIGRDPKKIPPFKDAALQARVNRIGNSLIPAYQQKLPESDLTKVVFRFQLIDDPKMNDALALPSGVILIPFQIVNYLKDDSQLATVLADNIATVLEKQSYRILPAEHMMAAANLSSAAVGLLIPGVGLASGIATYTRSKSIQTDLLNQSGRVSLGLLHDAGYDINQAPIAWWLLATNSADKLPSTPLPHRAANLYKALGTTWRNYSEDTTSATTTLQTK